MKTTVTYCDWCAAQIDDQMRGRQLKDVAPTGWPQDPVWMTWLCQDCLRVLDDRDFSTLAARRDLNAGAEIIERRARQ